MLGKNNRIKHALAGIAGHLQPTRMPVRDHHGDAGYNNHGFRGTSFEDRGDVNIALIGDESIEGFGIEVTKVASSILEQKLSEVSGQVVQCWNLGWSGKSADYLKLMTEAAIKYLSPNIVLLVFPDFLRWEYFLENGEVIDFIPERTMEIVEKRVNASPLERKIHNHLLEISSPYQGCVNFMTNYSARALMLDGCGINWAFSASDTPLHREWLPDILKNPLIDENRYIGHMMPTLSKCDKSCLDNHQTFADNITEWFIKEPSLRWNN